MKLSQLVVLGVSLAAMPSARPDPAPRPPKLAPVLAITKLDPAKGLAAGGTQVKIVGTGFIPGPEVPRITIYFGDRKGEIVQVTSDTEIVARAPKGKVGETVDVLVVFDGRGQRKLGAAFTYVGQK